MEADELRGRFEKVRTEGAEKIGAATDLDSLEEARVRVLGRKGPLSEARQGLKDVASEDRAAMGKLANEVQAALASAIEDKRRSFEAAEITGI